MPRVSQASRLHGLVDDPLVASAMSRCPMTGSNSMGRVDQASKIIPDVFLGR